MEHHLHFSASIWNIEIKRSMQRLKILIDYYWLLKVTFFLPADINKNISSGHANKNGTRAHWRGLGAKLLSLCPFWNVTRGQSCRAAAPPPPPRPPAIHDEGPLVKTPRRRRHFPVLPFLALKNFNGAGRHRLQFHWPWHWTTYQ